MLTIRHFKIFKAVAETTNMSEAAKLLYISQPTISQTISEMEKYYNAKLFDRYPKKLYITERGQHLLNYVNPLIDTYNKVNDLSLENIDSCRIRVGATYTVSTCILNDIMEASKARNPFIEFYVNVDNTSMIEQKLLHNDIDFAIVDGVMKSQDIVTVPIADDCLVLVCGKQHPFATRSQVSIEELNDQDVILREEGSGTRKLFEAEMLNKKIQYNIKWECSSMDAIKSAVINNQGIAIISARLIREELEQQKLFVVKVNECMWQKDIYLCYCKNKTLSSEYQPLMYAATAYYSEGVKCPIAEALKEE